MLFFHKTIIICLNIIIIFISGCLFNNHVNSHQNMTYSSESANQYISKKSGYIDHKLKSILEDLDVEFIPYRFEKNDKIMLLCPFEETGIMYNSEKELINVLNNVPQDDTPVHPLSSKIKNIDKFLNNLETVSDSLSQTFGITKAELNGSIKSLENISKILENGTFNSDYWLNNDSFLLISMYFGQVLATELDGQWQFEWNSDFDTFIPYVNDSQKRRYNFVNSLMEEFVINNNYQLHQIIFYEKNKYIFIDDNKK